MKKRITFLMVAVVAAVFGMQAQNRLLGDFEADVNKWTYWAFATFEIADNPNKSSGNNSDHVLKLAGATEGWAGMSYNTQTHGELPISISVSGEPAAGEYQYLHFKILRSNWASMIAELKDDTKTYNTTEKWIGNNTDWQYIVVDLRDKNQWSPSELQSSYPKIDMQPNKNSDPLDVTFYIDDIYLSASNEEIPQTITTVKNMGAGNSDIYLSRSANGNTVAHVGDLEGALKLEVYNLTGTLIKVVYNGTASAGAYELPSFGAGIYLLKATTSKGTYSLKF
jgi:hypothetical protein